MILHENNKIFKDAINATASSMKMSPLFVEKDYWVTFALYKIFNNDIGNETIFKGGTALSKCFGIIDRFSEDIDLVVIRKENESNNNLKSKLKIISNIVSEFLPEVNIPELTNKKGMNRKTAHSYNKEFSGSFGQIRDFIIIESSWLGYYEPFTTKKINSFIGEMLYATGRDEIETEYNMSPVEVKVLEPIRTICEKIMSLVRFSYGENPIMDLKNKIRHTYDLHQLLQQDDFLKFFNSIEFDNMLLKVAKDDQTSFKNNNKWLLNHPKESMFFKDLDSLWPDLKNVYNGDFKDLVYGVLPNENAVFNSMKKIQSRLANVDWDLKHFR